MPKCFVPVNNDTCLLRESYNSLELVLKLIPCINPKQCNGNLLLMPAQTLLGEAPKIPVAAGMNATSPSSPWLTSPMTKVTPERSLQLLILGSSTPTSTDLALLPAIKKLSFQLT